MVTWEVLDERGLLVRSGEDIASPVADRQRLARGAVVRQIQVKGNRLQYELISGTGPADGWVAIKLKDKELLVRKTVEKECSLVDNPISALADRSVVGISGLELTTDTLLVDRESADLQNITDTKNREDQSVAAAHSLELLPPLNLAAGFWRFDTNLPARDANISNQQHSAQLLSESMLNGALAKKSFVEALDHSTMQRSSHLAQQQHEQSLGKPSKNTDSVSKRLEQSIACLESNDLKPGRTPQMPVGADTYVHHESLANDSVPNGSTIISDGLAGVGLVQATMLVEQGSHHLTLASKRDAVSKEAQPFWETLKNSSAVIVHRRVGVSDCDTSFPSETHMPPIGRRSAGFSDWVAEKRRRNLSP